MAVVVGVAAGDTAAAVEVAAAAETAATAADVIGIERLEDLKLEDLKFEASHFASATSTSDLLQVFKF
jgi:hypothetical protein